ncbi:hypothetical protein Q5530_30970 [Saccharothrix sp. BKS2]
MFPALSVAFTRTDPYPAASGLATCATPPDTGAAVHVQPPTPSGVIGLPP